MIHGKTFLCFYLGPFVVDLGWFPGEPFVVLLVEVGMDDDEAAFYTIARVQVLRFVVSVGVER